MSASDTTAKAAPRMPRKWMWVSWGVVLAVGIAALMLGWWVSGVRQARVVAALRAMGWIVQYDFQAEARGWEGWEAWKNWNCPSDPENDDTVSEPRPWRWLAALLGRNLVYRVHGVYHVETLGAMGERISGDDAALRLVGSLPTIRWLSLAFGPFTDDGLVHIRGLKKLERLNLEETHVTENGLRHLGHFRHLQELRLGGPRIIHLSESTLEHFRNLCGLRSLVIRGTDLTDSELERLCQLLPNLEELSLRATQVTDDGLQALARLQNLRRLELGCMACGQGLEALRAVPTLTELALIDSGFSGAHLPPLSSFPNLAALRCWRVFIGREGMKRFGASTSLRELELESAAIEDGALEHMQMPHLRVLKLPYNPITDRGMACLPSLPELAELDISGTLVGDRGAAELGRFPRLRRLNVAYTRITEAAIPHLAQLRELQQLEITGTAIRGGAVKRLEAALPRCQVRYPLVALLDNEGGEGETVTPCLDWERARKALDNRELLWRGIQSWFPLKENEQLAR